MFLFFFFNDTATTEIYTLSLHDALPISQHRRREGLQRPGDAEVVGHVDRLLRPHFFDELGVHGVDRRDRKSTRLNSSHANISYAVFCLKKKKISILCQ